MLFTSRGLFEIWVRPFTMGHYLGYLQAYVNARESQSSSSRTGVCFRLNQGNFMVLQFQQRVWAIDFP